MANKRISDLPVVTSTTTGDVVPIDGATTRKVTVENLLGDNVQAIKGLTSAANKGIQFTGAGTAATYDLTTAGKALLDDADAAAQRTTLGLGSAATANTGTTGNVTPFLDGNNSYSGSMTLTGTDLKMTGGGGTPLQGTANGMYLNPNLTLVQVSAETVGGVEGGFFAYDTTPSVYMGSWSSHPVAIRTGNTARISIDTAGAIQFNNYGAGTIFADASGNLTAKNASDTRTALSLVPGTDVQAFDADLSAVAALSATGVVRRTGTNTWTAGAAVSNAEIAPMAAYTIKGNATGSSAVPTDISIPALTQKASPVAADKIMIADSAASNALKYATISSIASAGSVASIAGNTGAFTLSKGITNSTNDIQLALNNASVQTASGSPTGTTSTTQVMAGLGSTCKITPTYSGRALVQFQGSAFNSTTGNVFAQIRYGTGAAPSNGAAATGTTVGSVVTATIPTATYRSPISLSAIITGLTPGTAYWFDLGFAGNTGTSTIENVSGNAMEF